MEAEPQQQEPAPAHHHMAPPGILHEGLAQLAFLLGSWKGTGEGVWPPGDPFGYGEDLSFEDVGDTFLVYAQRSWSLEDGSPIHLERGFLRPSASGRVELMLAHPIGITEVAVGTVGAGVLEVASTAVALAPTASRVSQLRRRIEVRDGRLSYELHMAMDGVELLPHVRSNLERA
jgi:hypothetical protein